jgi:hypothetical protein
MAWRRRQTIAGRQNLRRLLKVIQAVRLSAEGFLETNAATTSTAISRVIGWGMWQSPATEYA